MFSARPPHDRCVLERLPARPVPVHRVRHPPPRDRAQQLQAHTDPPQDGDLRQAGGSLPATPLHHWVPERRAASQYPWQRAGDIPSLPAAAVAQCDLRTPPGNGPSPSAERHQSASDLRAASVTENHPQWTRP